MEIKKDRIWEIDFLRGIALILMVIFHAAYDMGDIFSYHLDYTHGLIYLTGRVAAYLFIFIAGVSSSLSRDNVRRGIKIYAIAAVLTVVTYLFAPEECIKFGVLHFLGISMILYAVFEKMDWYVLAIIGTIFVAAGNLMLRAVMPADYLFPFGLISSSFESADYYPIFPWFGLFLYGAAAGMIVYRNKKSLFSFKVRRNLLNLLGSHTLLIYLIHQPVILLVLYAIQKIH